MDPLVKQTLNALRCPICQSQVDLIDWKIPTSAIKYNFCCATDWEHYRLFFVHWEPVLRVEYETVVIYEGKHQYEIRQTSSNKTFIFVRDVDAENRVIPKSNQGLVVAPDFTYDKHLFDFAKTNRDKIVNRAKTILVFQ